MFNCTTKSDLKSATCIDASIFAKKADLAALKSVVQELDIDKLNDVPLELIKWIMLQKMKLLEKLYMINWLKGLMLLRLFKLLI